MINYLFVALFALFLLWNLMMELALANVARRMLEIEEVLAAAVNSFQNRSASLAQTFESRIEGEARKTNFRIGLLWEELNKTEEEALENEEEPIKKGKKGKK